MKTKQLFHVLLVVFLLGMSGKVFSQNLIEPSISDFNFSISKQQIDLRTHEVDIESFELQYDIENAPKSITENDAQSNVAAFALNMIAFGAGFGFTDAETLWCIHAAYYLQLAMLNNKALYGSIGFGYNGISGDFASATLLDVSLKLLMFSVLAKRYQQVRAIYGIFANYAFGNDKFNDGFKTDITRLALGLVVGLHILINQHWSFMVQTNVLTYLEQTTKYDNTEIKNNQIFGLINKGNLLLFSLVFTLPNNKR